MARYAVTRYVRFNMRHVELGNEGVEMDGMDGKLQNRHHQLYVRVSVRLFLL